ncbi:Crp/Fnr family transcriptional regulator [Paenibacillus sp. GCM10027627]|uniref:Crp/Fnr family transcriptional regulator n=1 Tax=unclassified Paenibacillus TaxID=185978 RepID=UPI00364259C6
MKAILDEERVQFYLSAFNLDAIFFQSVPSIQIRTYDRNELILKEGDPLDGLYIQVEGQTKVTTSVGTGKSLLLRFCYPLSVFGDIELIQHVPIQSQIEALQRTTILFIEKKTVEEDLMQNRAFMHLLLQHLSYKLQTCTTASRINLLSSVEERVASYFLTVRLQNEFGIEMSTQRSHEIASLIGTTPRHLNRVIQKLSDAGIVQKTKKSILVLDWGRLDEISNGLRYD